MIRRLISRYRRWLDRMRQPYPVQLTLAQWNLMVSSHNHRARRIHV